MSQDHVPDAGKKVAALEAEIDRLLVDLENARASRKQAQEQLYYTREQFQKELLKRTGEVSRLLKEHQDCQPVGYVLFDSGEVHFFPNERDASKTSMKHMQKLYAAPPAREPLTLEQIQSLPVWNRFVGLWPEMREAITRAIEAAHKIGGQS